MSELKRYNCDEDRSCEYEVTAIMREESDGAYVLYSEARSQLAALREAMTEIIVKVQESRSETRRLNWIEGRCQSALEGKPWVKGVFQMPDPKNGKPKEERLSREVAALREELAKAQALIVTSIMMDVVPGPDGMGLEVYAKSVADVQLLISNLYLETEEQEQRLADAERRNRELREALECLVRADSVTMGNAMDKAEAALNKPEEAKSSLDPSIIGIERMPPMEYDEP